jgi:hypothetical protein
MSTRQKNDALDIPRNIKTTNNLPFNKTKKLAIPVTGREGP